MKIHILRALFLILLLLDFSFLNSTHAGGRDHHRQRRSSGAKKDHYRRESPVGSEGFDPLLYNERISPHAFCQDLLQSWDTLLASQRAALASQALLKSLVPVSDAPGLFLLPESLRKYPDLNLSQGISLQDLLELEGIEKRFYPHELISGARYARFIQNYYGEKLVLTPSLVLAASHNGFVPGFDGFIVNREGRVFENVSLKTAETARNPRTAAAKAVESVKHFSYVEGWLGFFGLMRMKPNPELVPLSKIPAPRRRNSLRRIEQAYRLFEFSSEFLSRRVKRPRMTRIFIDMQDHVPMEIFDSTLRSIQEKIQDSGKTVSSVTISHNGVLYIVTGHDVSQIGRSIRPVPAASDSQEEGIVITEEPEPSE